MLYLVETKRLSVQGQELASLKESTDELKQTKTRLLAEETEKRSIEGLTSSPVTERMTKAQMVYLEADDSVVKR